MNSSVSVSRSRVCFFLYWVIVVVTQAQSAQTQCMSADDSDTCSSKPSQSEIPIIDLRPFIFGNESTQAAVIEQIGAVVEGKGLMLIRGHGIPSQLISSVFNITLKFFNARAEHKLSFVKNVEDDGSYEGMTGYTPLYTERFYGRYPDYKEAYDLDFRGLANGKWSGLPFSWSEQDQLVNLGLAMHHTVLFVSRAVSLYLGQSRNFLADLLDTYQNTILRAVHYPVFQPGHATYPNGYSVAPHTDYLPFAIDIPHSDGLQAWDKLNKRWLDVPTIPGTIVLNFGMMMQRWSNDRVVANMHRIVSIDHPRYAMVLFVGPRDTQILDPRDFGVTADQEPVYDPITCGEFLTQKLQLTRNKNIEERTDSQYGDPDALLDFE